jgi:uncharacterized protein (DUF1330 family)
VGGKLRYAGANPHNVIGDGPRPWWDAILVVEYPSPQAFVDMVRDPDYQKVHEHRAAALEQGTWSRRRSGSPAERLGYRWGIYALRL